MEAHPAMTNEFFAKNCGKPLALADEHGFNERH
jgi:hypothetical protein